MERLDALWISGKLMAEQYDAQIKKRREVMKRNGFPVSFERPDRPAK
jgi:DNA-binding helix-hairpin-helix protein with protein kinase domain